MIQEDYVSFETAKLLKEKGLEVIQTTYYDKDGKVGTYKNWFESQRFIPPPVCPRPTQALVLKWLRVTHKVYIYIPFTGIGGMFEEYNYQLKRDLFTTGGQRYKTPEEATEAAIQYTLNNLI